MKQDGQPTSDPSSSPCDLPWRCVSVDVEEYFHIEAAYGCISKAQWGFWPSRVEHNINLLLSLLNRCRLQGTFFILGHVAKRHPRLARRVAEAGHEVASHGTEHDRLHRLSPEAFRQDLMASKHLLEDQTGRCVIGYRAPTFSVVPCTAWAIDVLIEAGFQYDASIFPVRHHWYGVPNAPDRPFMVRSQPDAASLLEVPPLTWSVGSRNFPVAGGGYFRLLPLWLMRRGLAQAKAQGRPAVLYFHPWEFDPDMPRMPLRLLGRVRTYTGLRSAAKRLESIMQQPARWSTIAESLGMLQDLAAANPAFCLQSHP